MISHALGDAVIRAVARFAVLVLAMTLAGIEYHPAPSNVQPIEIIRSHS